MKYRTAHRKVLHILLSLTLVASMTFALMPSTAAAAVTVEVNPKMLSLWGLGLLPDPNFSPGPGHTTIIVAGVPSTATVRLNLKSVFESLFPTVSSRIVLFPQDVQDAYRERLNSFASIGFEWDEDMDVWRHELGQEYAFTEPISLARVVAERVLFEDAVLGQVTVPVTVGSTTYSLKVWVVDMQRPLLSGWNTLSTPAALAVSRWGDIVKMGGGVSYDAAVDWDHSKQAWVNVRTTDTLRPMNAWYVHATSFSTVGFIFSRAATAPPSRPVGAGWNFVAPAVVMGKDGAGDDAFFQMPADQVFRSVATTYTSVVSPGESWSYTQTFSRGGVDYSTYDWSFDQDSWLYIADTGTPPQMVVGGGYWAHVNSAGTLAGYSQTPIRLTEWDPFP